MSEAKRCGGCPCIADRLSRRRLPNDGSTAFFQFPFAIIDGGIFFEVSDGLDFHRGDFVLSTYMMGSVGGSKMSDCS